MKLFVTDYDGTLYCDDDSLRKNIESFNKLHELDFKIMISTGRSFSSIKNQVTIYNIPYDYLSCADGSIIYDNNDNILTMFKMDNKIIKPIEDFYQNLEYEEIQFSYPRAYSNILNENNSDLLGINICIVTEKYTKDLVNDFIEMSKLYPEYHFLNYMHPNYSYLCVKPSGIDKSSTIDYLKEKFNMNDFDIYVIGDSYNDKEMIEKYHGVCMKDAWPEIINISKKAYDNVYDYIEDIIT